MLGSLGSMMSGGMSWEKSHPARPTRYEPGLNGPSTKLPSASIWTMAAGSRVGRHRDRARRGELAVAGDDPTGDRGRRALDEVHVEVRVVLRPVGGHRRRARWRGGVDREAPGEVATRASSRSPARDRSPGERSWTSARHPGCSARRPRRWRGRAPTRRPRRAVRRFRSRCPRGWCRAAVGGPGR